MSEDLRPHPVFVNYETSRDGVIRNRRLKQPGVFLNNQGYLLFIVGKKSYLCHRIVYEAFYGLIKDGFVIDHKNGIKTYNSLNNLRVVTQSENTKIGLTHKSSKPSKRVKSFDLENNEEKVFQSMNEVSRHFDICISSVRFVAENITRSAISKQSGHKVKFIYIKGDNPFMDIQ